MYNLLFDADAVIKLTYSGTLPRICRDYNCVMTEEVKRETVDEGKRRFYPDAEIIEELINTGFIKIKNPKNSGEEVPGLESGELSVLALWKENPDFLIVSDDQAFLKELQRQEIDFVVPADLLLLLTRAKKINKIEARKDLEKLRTFIREEDYHRVNQELGG